MDERFDAGQLERFASTVLRAAGMPGERADVVAGGLLRADLYGHDTHGLALLAEYVEEIESGEMAVAGEPAVLSSHGAVACWDAGRLPGVWTTTRAVEEATRRAAEHGIGAIALRRSHHIACLAAYLEAPARDGYVVLVFSSDPSDAHVAPFGGTGPVMTPNPVAAGIPTGGDPILIDISASITTAGMCARKRGAGETLPGDWLLDADGTPTDDPGALGKGGSILPIGGIGYGHKGFALGILVEALTQGLSGHGRADAPTTWGASVLVVAISPALFGAQSDYARQVDWLVDACRGSTPAPGSSGVRLPGERALARKANALREGVALYPGIADALRALAQRFGIDPPRALGG